MCIPNDDGIYMCYSDSFHKVVADGPFVPEVDGVYVIYFRNVMCPGCKAFDKVWQSFVSAYRDKAKYVVIQCKNFFHECKDSTASDSFIFYLVFETPQTIIIVVENSLPVYIEREVGFIDIDKLKDFVLNVRERMLMSMSMESEAEEGEGIYIDFSKRDWKEIVKELKKLILEGKSIREVCTAEGCRIVLE